MVGGRAGTIWGEPTKATAGKDSTMVYDGGRVDPADPYVDW